MKQLSAGYLTLNSTTPMPLYSISAALDGTTKTWWLESQSRGFNHPALKRIWVCDQFDKVFRRACQQIFKKRYKKYRFAFNCVAFTEKKFNEPYHIHALIEKPKNLSEADFEAAFRDHWTHGNVFIKKETEGKYLTYSGKFRNKELNTTRFSDSLIVSSLVLNNTLPK